MRFPEFTLKLSLRRPQSPQGHPLNVKKSIRLSSSNNKKNTLTSQAAPPHRTLSPFMFQGLPLEVALASG